VESVLDAQLDLPVVGVGATVHEETPVKIALRSKLHSRE
jgi:hypothetical protein